MTKEQNSTNAHLEQGKALARMLFDYKLSELEHLTASHPELRQKFPIISDAEYLDVVDQVRVAKLSQQKHSAWQLVPRDLAVILVATLTWLLNDWRLPLVFGIFLLILLANVFAVWFSEKLALILGNSVWFSYFALLAYGWFFLRDGGPWYIALLAALGLGIGSHLLMGFTQMMLAVMDKARTEANSRRLAEKQQITEKNQK